MKILLGSGSPRRRQLLGAMDLEFDVVKLNDVKEVYPEDMAAEEVPVYLSQLKSASYRPQLTEAELLITADTVVILDGDIIGKPRDREDAITMIKRLSGNTHKVVTGVTLALNLGNTETKISSFSETTEVKFSKLTDEEIINYVDKYRPFDKAGAYGVQEWIGMVGVESINGCFYNVMGLPTSRLHKELDKILS